MLLFGQLWQTSDPFERSTGVKHVSGLVFIIETCMCLTHPDFAELDVFNIPIQIFSFNPIPTPKPCPAHNLSLKYEANNTDVEVPNPGCKP